MGIRAFFHKIKMGFVSHVLEAIGLNHKYAKGTIRIPLGRENSLNDVEIIANSILKILGSKN